MTVDEMREALMGTTNEGADAAGTFDTILTEVTGVIERAEAAEAQVAELSSKIAELTQTNLQLLDKIRYVEAEPEQEAAEEELPEITIDNLFEEV